MARPDPLQLLRHQPARRAASGGLMAPVLLLTLFSLVLASCSASSIGSTPRPTTTATTAPSPTAASATATPAGYPVKVYFSKHPESDNSFSAVFPMSRVSPTLGVGTYAIQQLIAGPTPSEAATGLFTELTAALSGSSNCGGPDFQYTIDNTTHTGTLRLCKTTSLPGDASGPRIKAEITATLTQFPNVTKVIILNSSGHCFDDLSGQDSCLR